MALGFAEATFFPEVGILAAGAVLALLLIYRLEYRVESLTIPAANWLGVAIACLYALWAIFRVVRELHLNEFAMLGWQLLTLPIFGPLLILAVPAKLLRTNKTIRDWWMIHSIGLAKIALAGTIADTAIVLVLIGIYSCVGIWSLTEFYSDRNAMSIAQMPNLHSLSGLSNDSTLVDTITWRLARTVCWFGLAAVSAIGVYLITPRSSAERLQFGATRIEIGYASNHLVDLRRSAELLDNPDPAFEVRAEHLDGQLKTDLSPNQRWRGTTLIRYNQGVWVPERYVLPTATERAENPLEEWTPPDMGPDGYRLIFNMLIDDRSYFLADPVTWLPKQSVPVASICSSGLRGWGPTFDGSGNFTRMHCGSPRLGPRRYIQYLQPTQEPDLGPAFQLASQSKPAERLRDLLANYPRRVRDYADQLMARLVEEHLLPREALSRVDSARESPRVPEKYHETVARAFSYHLANSTEFEYTTHLQRVQSNDDPVAEFLFDLKSGHCERFAAALVMMLRSQGIPAVLVLGFRGCEIIEPGRWIVRQRDAHAWVEVLISRPARGAMPGETHADWHWLSLDPTPDRVNTKSTSEQQQTFWVRTVAWVNSVFLHYFVNYTPERRDHALQAIRTVVLNTTFLIICGCGLILFIGVRLLNRHCNLEHSLSIDSQLWIQHLYKSLAPHGFIQSSGQTPREFAHAVADVLLSQSSTKYLSNVPIKWTEAYYRIRYGNISLSDDQRVELSRLLQQLLSILKS
jgi:transglutaminase-like putative cysteine protease